MENCSAIAGLEQVSLREREFWRAAVPRLGWAQANAIYDSVSGNTDDVCLTAHVSMFPLDRFKLFRATPEKVVRAMQLADGLGVGHENAMVLLANCVEFGTVMLFSSRLREYYYYISERNMCSGYLE